MADNKNTPCIMCGDQGEEARVTDKVKYNNKKAGKFYIRFKGNEENAMLCRICWQKNIQNMVEKMTGPNEKYLMNKSMNKE